MAKKNRAALAQLDEALHAVGDCDQAVWTLKKSIGECRSRLGGGSFASTAAEARQIARALAMCAKSIDAAVAAAVAESVAAAEKAPGGATPVAWGAGKGRKESGGAGSNGGAVGMSTPAARTRPASAPLDMDSPAAARLIAAARETVTVHLVRPRKPPTTSENNNNNLKPPVAAPPKPVPFQFQRRVRDEVEPAVGIGAFAQLLPAMQEKLGMATHVVEVVGADGCVRRSDADFVDGEVCTVYGAADSRRARKDTAGLDGETHDSACTAVSSTYHGSHVVASKEGLVRLATASARMSRVVVNLIPTSSRVKAMAGELTESPTEVTLPASCSTRVECVRVCEGALYKSKRICTPLLGLYAADGSSLGGVEGLLNGDVLLYRTAKEPAPNVGGGASIPRGTSQRARTASLAAPKAEWCQSFEVSVSRVGCERDAVPMRLPSRGLENMSRVQLGRRIRMACALSPDTDVDAVYAMPHAEKVEHPAQLAGATRVVYTLEGDESPKPEPGALKTKKKNSKATSVKTMKSNDAPVYNPRPNTAPPSRLRPSTRKTQYGFGGVVPFAGKEYLPSAMAKSAKSSSKKAATLQAYQLELGDSYDGLVTSAITPRSSAEKLLVNNPMGLQHRRPRPESARREQTPIGSKEDESVQNSVGHFDLRASFERGGSISIPASPGQTPVRERWEVNAASMDATTLRVKNAEAASAWAEYHEKNAWPSPELRRIAELGYVPAPVASPADTARQHLRG